MKVAVIGGGAAGFFSAIAVKQHHPEAVVILFEKAKKVLSKVKISGGGRCNVTNGCTSIKELATAYPRGGKALKKAFKTFHTKHTMEWFEKRGVALMTQEDNCVFPVSQDSQSIIDCLLKETRHKNITVATGQGIQQLNPLEDGKIELTFAKADHAPQIFDKVIVATGGSPTRKGLHWLEYLGHQIEDPVPSLFTFNMPQEPIRKLMGIVAEKALVSVQGTKLRTDGPLLITHWGMSGPAILKSSAFGARLLSESGYKFNAQINWVGVVNNAAVLEALQEIVQQHPQKQLANYRPYLLPERLWHFLLEKAELPLQKKWNELGKKGLHKLTTILTNDTYEVSGKTTFKEEFVTCGGVSLESIDMRTMQSKVCPNLYFCGEVMDIDGITGGYNFQAAWTTGFIAGKLLD